MKRIPFILIFLVFFFSTIYSQYWQQKVNYKIDCNLDTKLHIISGSEALIYLNNSPDTLKEMVFHLYQNSYTPGSYNFAKQNRKFKPGEYPESDWGWTKLIEVKNENNENLTYEVDNTIATVKLDRPIPPGGNFTIKIKFDTKFSSLRHRMNYQRDEWGNLQYSVAQWYPKICVYDKYGWHDDQDFGHEFYGEFGDFDVNITLPAHFILDATGVLQNRNEVLPDDLLQKIDIKNFKDKPYGEKPSVIIPETERLKTWKFHAENVHDFAWIADPTFRRGYAEWDGIQVISYAREYKASRWQDAADFTSKVVEIYSKDFGKYCYPKVIVSDVDNGMEYPMLTMDGGESPDYYGLLAHEVGHMWFYGIIGNNETAEAYLDEGFTQFIESWSMERLTDEKRNFLNTGEYIPGSPPKWTAYRESGCYNSYFQLANSGFDEKINTHSDWLNDNNTYGVTVYSKPATMLYNLQYVLGDEMFLKVMRDYFKKWSLKHPTTQDFIESAQNTSQRNLSWFFEQWLNTTKKCDYRISGVSTTKKKIDNSYSAQIELERIGTMIMPIDLAVKLESGKILNYHIPVDRFSKSEKGLTILPKWSGWNDWNKTYVVNIDLPDDIEEVTIDTSRRLADLNRLDNKWPVPEIEFDFWNTLKMPPSSFYKANILWRPDLWFNDISGVKFGFKINTEYPRYFVNQYLSLDLNVWYGIRDNKFNIEFRSKGPNKLGGSLSFSEFLLYIMDGRAIGSLTFSKRFLEKLYSDNYIDVSGSIKHFQLYDDKYLLKPERWDMGKVNSINLSVTGLKRTEIGQIRSTMNFMSTIMGTDFDFSKITFQNLSYANLFGLNIKSRMFIGYTRGNLPSQELFYLAGASPIDEFSEKYPETYFKSRGLIPNELLREGHIYLEGGVNLRGYQDQNICGTRAFSFNITLAAQRVKNIFGFVTPYLFYDMGNVDTEIRKGFMMNFFTPFKHDAGIGFNLRLPHVFSIIGLSSIGVDFPLWVSHPSFYIFTDNPDDNLKFRWVLSINKNI